MLLSNCGSLCHSSAITSGPPPHTILSSSPSTHDSCRAHPLSHPQAPPPCTKKHKCSVSMLPFATLHELRRAVSQITEGACFADSSVYAFLLRECGKFQSLDDGVRLHECISSEGWDRDTYVGNHLVEMYAKCGAIPSAQLAFDAVQDHNVYSWTIILAAYADCGETKTVMRLLDEMQQEGVQPNNITFINILGAICTNGTLEQAWQVHAIVVETGQESDVLVGSSLVNTYGKCGSVVEAGVVFQRLHSKNCVTWNALIEAHVRHGNSLVALELFHAMNHENIVPSKVTFTSALGAYSSESALEQGRAMHAAIIENGYETGSVIGTAILSMYGRSKSLNDAERMLNRMHSRTIGTWNAIISVYAQLKSCVHAIRLFLSLQTEGVIPNNISFVHALGACTNVAAAQQGKLIHTQLVLYGLSTDTILDTALLTMYGKCGGHIDARNMFDNMHSRDAIVWNAMLTAYTQYGHVKESFDFYLEMLEAGIKPNEVTFVSILSVCGRVGMVNEGLQHFGSIQDVYGLTPTIEHYGCMIDLFGRAGLLDEGEQFLAKMRSPNLVVWETLLAACQVHGDAKRGKRVAERVIELNPKNSSAYILLSNVYAGEGKWDKVAEIREAMELRGFRKEPGLSVIEVGTTLHEFTVKDKSHPLATEIYAVLNGLKSCISAGAHEAQDRRFLGSVVDDEFEESELNYHSVKLAIAFGHLATPPRAQLRVTKNLRICSDCHSWAKHVSKITERRIVLWDVKHVHEFIDGACLCGDYW